MSESAKFIGMSNLVYFIGALCQKITNTLQIIPKFGNFTNAFSPSTTTLRLLPLLALEAWLVHMHVHLEDLVHLVHVTSTVVTEQIARRLQRSLRRTAGYPTVLQDVIGGITLTYIANLKRMKSFLKRSRNDMLLYYKQHSWFPFNIFEKNYKNS